MFKLSIIIPVYNVEKYIEECLKSIIDQLVPEVEIIIINDGSPDDSINIVKSILRKLSKCMSKQFVIIEQENQGLSVARNTGITYANGKYIGFLDSDDKFMPNYFEEIIKVIDCNAYDIVDFNFINSLGTELKTRSRKTSGLSSVFQCGNWFCPGRVVKSQLLTSNKFIPGIYYEDLALIPILYTKAKATAHIDQPLYWYRINPEGITMSSSDEKNALTISSFKFILNHYLTLYQKERNPYLYYIIVQSFFLLCINACRRFSLYESLKYLSVYSKQVNAVTKDTNAKSISLTPKLKLFLTIPKSYLLNYNLYCKLRTIKASLH